MLDLPSLVFLEVESGLVLHLLICNGLLFLLLFLEGQLSILSLSLRQQRPQLRPSHLLRRLRLFAWNLVTYSDVLPDEVNEGRLVDQVQFVGFEYAQQILNI